MERNSKIRIALYSIAAICFGIVSYGNMCSGKTSLAMLYFALTVSQVCLAFSVFNNSK